MYDTLKFILLEKDLGNKVCFIEEVSCRLTDVKYYNNKAVGRIKNMLVDIRGTTLIVEGSLTKWFLGNNYERFLLLWEIRSAIRSLGSALGVSIEKAKVSRIDIAFNFRVSYVPWLYLTKLLYFDSYHRSNIEKETLYFDRYDCQLVFYDKMSELKSCGVEELEDLKDLNLLRYEFRFKKVTKLFGEVRGSCLYDSDFCLSLLEKWYRCYMDIDKQVEEVGLKFTGVKGMKESCVALCMSEINMFEAVEEAFVKKEINSAVKFAVLQELRRIGSIYCDCDNEKASLIDELTKKIKNAYVMLKRRYNVSPARLELLNRSHDNVS